MQIGRSAVNDQSRRECIQQGLLLGRSTGVVHVEYMLSQTAALKELSARATACSSQITTTEIGSSTDEHVPHEFLSIVEVSLQTTCSKESICEGPPQKKEPSLLSKLRAKELMNGLVLLNVRAALYGSTAVTAKFATDVAAILETCGNGGASSDAPLLFAFTVISVPIMELCGGQQSVRNITRIASLVALSGMGVLEEEGLGWKGISIPQVGDVWGLAASAVYALHIFRSEAHSKNCKPFELTAIQCGTVASLTLVWEILRLLHENTTPIQYISQLHFLPWGPLVYTGLVSSGLCSWLEIHGFRSVHASTATMVNTTIPIWPRILQVQRIRSLDMASRVSMEFFPSVDMATTSALAKHSVVCAHHVDVAVLQIILACGVHTP